MKTKNAFITIVGKANVGKSSLLNALVGEKIAAVSSKPQTTRTKITGVLTKDETQFVFIDTPGMHKAATKLSEQMIKTISNSISDVEVAILMVDATKKPSAIEEKLAADFKKCGTDVILLLNKVDLIKNKSEILKIIENYSASNIDSYFVDARPYNFAFFKDDKLVLTILFTRHNGQKDQLFINAKEACERNGIKCLNFFEQFPNYESYVISRIRENL